MRCGFPKESDTDCPPCKTSKQEVIFPVCLPKAVKHQLSIKQHSIAVAWWATVEVLFGRIDHKTNQLKQLNCLDWARQEGVMAEALCTYAPNATNIIRFPEPKGLTLRGGMKLGG
jgi:hypothetical protein